MVLLDARWARGALAAARAAAAELRGAMEAPGAWTRSASPASGRCTYAITCTNACTLRWERCRGHAMPRLGVDQQCSCTGSWRVPDWKQVHVQGRLCCLDEPFAEGVSCPCPRALRPMQAGASPSTAWRSGPRPLWWQGWPSTCRRHRKFAAPRTPRSALSRLSWYAHIAACLYRVDHVLKNSARSGQGGWQPGLRRHYMCADAA